MFKQKKEAVGSPPLQAVDKVPSGLSASLKCRYFSGFKAPEKSSLCSLKGLRSMPFRAFDPIRGGLRPLELPLRNLLAFMRKRIFRQAEAGKPFPA
jgi:hypothetical protein